MANIFDRLQRGLAAAKEAVGGDDLAHTNAFELAQSANFPVATVRRVRSNGEIVVEVTLGPAIATMTIDEFDRFADELNRFRTVARAAVDAAKRVEWK